MGSPSQSFISTTFAVSAVDGENTAGGIGISGTSVNGNPIGGQPGVKGVSDFGPGVFGQSNTNHAVHGHSLAGRGVVGISDSFVGITGTCDDAKGIGVTGTSVSGIGISGQGGKLAGLFEGAVQVDGPLTLNAQDALHLVGFGPFLTLVDNENNSIASAGIQNIKGDLFFFSDESRKTGRSQLGVHNSGDVTMTGTLSVAKDVVLTGADCAEHFDAIPDTIFEPGTVMAIGNGGVLDASTKAYDKKVAGVVSGAGTLRPAVILDRQPSNAGRPAVALVGKVYCKVDADYGAVEVGDLLTTSNTLGYAMKVSDPGRAFGAVIGKALRPLKAGRELIPILIALQ